MTDEERTFRGHYAFDTSLRLKLSMGNPTELRLVVEHHDGSAHIALNASEANKLRDSITEWLEQTRRPPQAARRHS